MENPVIQCENHDLHVEQEAMRPESHCKQSILSKVGLAAGSLATKTKIQEMLLEYMANCKT